MPLHLSSVEHEIDQIIEQIFYTDPWEITIKETQYERMFGPVHEQKINYQLITMLYPQAQALWEDKYYVDIRHTLFGRTQTGKPTPNSKALLIARIEERAVLEINAIQEQLFRIDGKNPIFHTGQGLKLRSCLYQTNNIQNLNSLAHETNASDRAINEKL